MSGFEPYPAYKDSGVEWLGEIPEHWEFLDAKRLFTNIRERPGPEAVQLAATQAYGVVPQAQFMEREGQKVVLALSGTENFRGVQVDDFVISLRSFQGGIEVSRFDGCVSPAYTVLRAKNSSKICTNFFRYLFKEKSFISALQSVTSGIREGRTITYDQFGVLPLPVPGVTEADQIARFLDHETARIDALIAEQELLIELLKEKRQAVISHAVTKGLNPDVPMKDSGVEWLGQVPAHWGVVSFYLVVEIAEGQVNPQLQPFSDMTLIAPNHVESGTGRLIGTETAAEQGADSGKYLCRPGDVVYSKIRPALRKVCIAPEECLCSADMYPMRGRRGLGMSNLFLYWFILSEPFSAFALMESDRVAMPKINRESLGQFKVVRPPVSEQLEITERLNQASQEIDSLIEVAGKAAIFLKERRSALISAAVTGKIDVRAWRPPADAPSLTEAA